jgi:hypothetical protein
MTGAIGLVRFPEEWVKSRWTKTDALAVATLTATGSTIALMGGVLEDGTCLYGLAFPGGQRVMRISPETEWAIEERFEGKPRLKDRKPVNNVWRSYVDSLIEAKRMAERELGPPR